MPVNLVKGQKLSLEKTAGTPLRRLILGLGWDLSPGADEIDLDASCATYDAGKNQLEVIYFGNTESEDESIRHSGDNLTGAGAGDDEQITVELERVPAAVQSIVFTVTSYQGQPFTAVANAYVRVVNAADGTEVCRYNLSGGASTTGLILARLYRHGGEWKIAALGEPADGETIEDLGPAMVALL